MPDSLLTACKKVAELAGVPWSKAQPIYRALQAAEHGGAPLLPVSRGRAVAPAEPIHVLRFLVGLATNDEVVSAAGNVVSLCFLPRLDRDETVEEYLAPELVRGWRSDWKDTGDTLSGLIENQITQDDPRRWAAANTDRVGAVDFHTDQSARQVRVNLVGGPTVRFRIVDRRDLVSPIISKVITVQGKLFARIARAVKWPITEEASA